MARVQDILAQFQAKGVETCFHGRHIDPQIYAGLNGSNWGLKDYEARGGYQGLLKGDYLTVTEAVHLADELLYHVKQHGKHNIACYEGKRIRLIRPLPDDAFLPTAAIARPSPLMARPA